MVNGSLESTRWKFPTRINTFSWHRKQLNRQFKLGMQNRFGFCFCFFLPKMQIVNFIYAATVIYFFQNQSTVFCVRCGTPRGIITHWFRSETNRDMAAWARALVQGSHNAINYQREFSFRCLYQVMSKTELHRIRWINFCSFFFAISHNIFFLPVARIGHAS